MIFEKNKKTIELNGYDFNIFETNSQKFYTNNFCEILKNLTKDEQIALLKKVLIDCSKAVTTFEAEKLKRDYKSVSPITLLKKYMIEVCVFYANKEVK